MCVAFVIDSIPFYSTYNKNLLEQEEGVYVQEFSSPNDMINAVEAGNIPDVVVMDTILPFMNGPDLIEKISKINNKIKFLVVTSDRRHIGEIKHKHIPVMEKPFLVSEFRKTFRKVRANGIGCVDDFYRAYEEGSL